MLWDWTGLNGYQLTDIDVFHLGKSDVRCFTAAKGGTKWSYVGVAFTVHDIKDPTED